MDEKEINNSLLVEHHAPQHYLKCSVLLRRFSSPFCSRGYCRLPSAIKSSLSLKLLEGLHSAQLWSLILRIEFCVWAALQFWMQPCGWL